ncbi:glycosyltransferase [Altererythrobacter confluentis]|uniref:Glycosyltransferase n=1 Tax=Allopontixanthobacter confluentis TaxID=1849021 RepID=A0A6L7GDN1_9SPHN|nr:glycosyltransferase family A protein [Allopontixanthobacter confluentis]MXP14182.1 glycosyltransferase [Allopontixanthobacter confluentis]
MTDPTFSVVIAAYNAELTIQETIDSVLAQSDEDFELIVIDDGSEDLTLPVVLRKGATDIRIKVATQPNQGVSAARNLGVAKARGQYLAFLDADDIWHCDKLARHRALHDSDPAIEASYARIAFCPDKPGKIRAGRTSSTVREGYCALEDVVIENVVCTMSNLVIERDTFLEIGGFHRQMRHVEDQDLLSRLVGGGRLLRGIPETLVGYRMSAEGLSCDFQAMLAGWRKLAEQWSHEIDVKRGEALYCRYLARRALRSGTTMALARDFVRQGIASDSKAFLGNGSRGLMTLGAAIAGSVIPERARTIIFA